MGVLSSNKKSFLGIDFDTRGIKMVELSNDHGRPRLVTYAYVDASLEGSSTGFEYDHIAALLKAMCKKAKTTTPRTISALPAFSVFSSILNLPDLPRKELESAVSWEAKKVIPLPIDDMILDWKILDDKDLGGAAESAPKEDEPKLSQPEALPGEVKRKFQLISAPKTKKTLRILLTAAPKDLVKKYIDTFRAANLQLLSLDTEAFAQVRSLIGNDRAPVMIVDIGAAVTTISIVVSGIPILNRSINAGGFTVTKIIANSLNVSLGRAEQFKYDIGMNADQAGQGNIPKIIESAIIPILDEVKYSLQLYKNQGQKTLEKIILTGGSSLLAHLPEYMSNALQMRVYRGDAWARVMYPDDLRPILDEVGPRFSVAVGLAMRDIA